MRTDTPYGRITFSLKKLFEELGLSDPYYQEVLRKLIEQNLQDAITLSVDEMQFIVTRNGDAPAIFEEFHGVLKETANNPMITAMRNCFFRLLELEDAFQQRLIKTAKGQRVETTAEMQRGVEIISAYLDLWKENDKPPTRLALAKRIIPARYSDESGYLRALRKMLKDYDIQLNFQEGIGKKSRPTTKKRTIRERKLPVV